MLKVVPEILRHALDVVRPVFERHYVLDNLRARLEFLPEQVDFVVDEDQRGPTEHFVPRE